METFTLQNDPVVTLVLHANDFEIKGPKGQSLELTPYSELKNVRFTPGKVSILLGVFSAFLEFILGSGAGHWKKGAGRLELEMVNQTVTIPTQKYDKGNIEMAIEQVRKRSQI
jgi:hypothetical protein